MPAMSVNVKSGASLPISGANSRAKPQVLAVLRTSTRLFLGWAGAMVGDSATLAVVGISTLAGATGWVWTFSGSEPPFVGDGSEVVSLHPIRIVVRARIAIRMPRRRK